jgi:hypothetical protein
MSRFPGLRHYRFAEPHRLEQIAQHLRMRVAQVHLERGFDILRGHRQLIEHVIAQLSRGVACQLLIQRRFRAAQIRSTPPTK